MSDSSNNTDDLAAFEAEFYQTAKPVEEKAEVETEVEEVVEHEDEPLATEEEVDADEGDVEPEDVPVPEKKVNPIQKRIQDLNAKLRETERAAEAEKAELLKRLDEALARVEVKTPEPAPVKEAETTGPTPEDVDEDGTEKYPLGEFDPKYIRDLTKFTLIEQSNALKVAAAEEARLAAEAEQANMLKSAWTEKVVEAEKVYPDFVKTSQKLDTEFAGMDPQYGEYLASTIMSMDHGPDVLYYLATNVDEARKIANLGPVNATIALGRLEAQFVKGATPTKTVRVSEAPEPIQNVTRGSAGRFDVADDTDDLDAFEKKFFKK